MFFWLNFRSKLTNEGILDHHPFFLFSLFFFKFQEKCTSYTLIKISVSCTNILNILHPTSGENNRGEGRGGLAGKGKSICNHVHA